MIVSPHIWTITDKKQKIRVRFHLARGENYMKWQVRHGKEVRYFEPENFTFRLKNCQLKNKPSDAERIYSGENKRVCAWINCESIEIYDSMDIELTGILSEQIRYNPRVAPNWADSEGNNIDNQSFKLIVSDDRGLYIP